MRLDEFTKDEWRSVCKKFHPEWTDDDFEKEWVEFQEFKAKVWKSKKLS